MLAGYNVSMLAADIGSSLFPLLSGQSSTWLQYCLHQVDTSNSVAMTLEVGGPVEPELFRRSISILLSDVEMFRVSLQKDATRPMQSVRSNDLYEPLFIDLSQEEDPRSAFRSRADQITSSIRLSQDERLYEFALFKIDVERYHILIATHHILADGWSGVKIAERLAAIYSALAECCEPTPNPFGAYRSLVDAEQRYRASVHYEKDRKYWTQQLADWEGPSTLTTISPVVISRDVLRSSETIPLRLIKEIHNLAAECQSTIAEVLTLCTALYVARMSSRWDVVTSMPFSGRVGTGSQSAPGLMMNVLPFRLKFDPQSKIGDALLEVSRLFRAAMRHQRFPGGELRHLLGLSSASSQAFGPGINLELFRPHLRFGKAEAIYSLAAKGFVEDVMFAFTQRASDADLNLYLDANAGLYEQAELALHSRRLLHFLEQTVANAGQRLADIPLLPPEEAHLTMSVWNGRKTRVNDTPWHELVEERCLATPDKIAAHFRDETLTFRELNERSNQLARHLRKLGVKRNAIVGVLLGRSLDIIVALLGIAKAGGAYLPLDEGYPNDLLRFMIEDAAPLCILTHSGASTKLGDLPVPRVFLDSDALSIAAYSAESVACAIEPDDAAYVIFTSGTTGRPKGTVVRHGGVSNLVAAEREKLAITAQSTFLVYASISFDASFSQIGTPLCAGATLVICPPEDRAGWRLGQIIRAYGVTHAEIPPAILASLPDELSLELPNLIVSGEACTSSVAKRWSLGRRMFNAYGPAEATVTTTIGLLQSNSPLTIGGPLPNTQVYVLDDQLRPLPIGATGEICIGGAGVAKGYLNRPELTAARFLANPFGDPGGRLYRTGDVARWRLNGELEFLGRTDSQVKIRGLRIELAEIEKALDTHPEVNQAVAAAVEDKSGQKILAAYIIMADAKPIDSTQFRKHLSALLPQFMIPACFMRLEHVPLTANGKVDRKNLPLPVFTAKRFEAPQTEIEEVVCAAIRKLLQVDEVGLNDNFFELGGHSLAGLELLQSLEQCLSVRIPLSSLFVAETIRELCEFVATSAKKEEIGFAATTKLIPLNAGEKSIPPLVLIHGLNGSFRSFRHLVPRLPAHQPILAVQYADPLEGENLAEWFAAVKKELLRKITSIQPKGPYRVAGHCVGGVLAYEVACDLLASENEVAFVGLLDSHSRYYRMRIASRCVRKTKHLRKKVNEVLGKSDLHTYKQAMAEAFAWIVALPRRAQPLLQLRFRASRNSELVTPGSWGARPYTSNRLDMPVHLFVAEGSAHQFKAPYDYGWSSCAAGDLVIEKIQGDHLSMLEPAYVGTLATCLARHMSREQPS